MVIMEVRKGDKRYVPTWVNKREKIFKKWKKSEGVKIR